MVCLIPLNPWIFVPFRFLVPFTAYGQKPVSTFLLNGRNSGVIKRYGVVVNKEGPKPCVFRLHCVWRSVQLNNSPRQEESPMISAKHLTWSPSSCFSDIPTTMLCGGRVLVEHAPNGACVLSRALAPPSPNFWDPAGFTADGSVENFQRRRQTELKHGRISMLATMGYITP
ncbi:unnamed protein product, partial [Durusdinium trenchii]